MKQIIFIHKGNKKQLAFFFSLGDSPPLYSRKIAVSVLFSSHVLEGERQNTSSFVKEITDNSFSFGVIF